MSVKNKLSIILPSKNEGASLRVLLPEIINLFPEAEVILVNDGSTDDTSEICRLNNVKEVRHPYSKGNGAAIKSGTRAATGDTLVFMDADGQHSPADISRLLEKMDSGYDMVVGARSRESQASVGRLVANSFYNKFGSWMVDKRIDDLTSGFRVVKANLFNQVLHLLPNGFSYPTTSTMAFFRFGFSVGYLPITADKRVGESHINLVKDGVRFFLIIFKIGTLYSPFKIFIPISFLLFTLGMGRYVYTYLLTSTFTNMSALLLSTSLLVFLIGLVSEQITTLIYQSQSGQHDNEQ